MLHHFILIFPTGFEGVLATYLHYSPHIFPMGFLEETFKIIQRIFQDDGYTQEEVLYKGEC